MGESRSGRTHPSPFPLQSIAINCAVSLIFSDGRALCMLYMSSLSNENHQCQVMQETEIHVNARMLVIMPVIARPCLVGLWVYKPSPMVSVVLSRLISVSKTNSASC